MSSKRIITEILSIQFCVFLCVGFAAALINFGSRFLFRYFVSYTGTILIGFFLGTIASFFFNKKFTFTPDAEHASVQFSKFILLACGGIFLATIIAHLFVIAYQFTGLQILSQGNLESAGHLSAIAMTTIYNFFAIKYIGFKKINLGNHRHQS